jgi:predicted ATPase/DNA-binding SARP family transcriptional activator/Tfp pilus assembly protein PilF
MIVSQILTLGNVRGSVVNCSMDTPREHWQIEMLGGLRVRRGTHVLKRFQTQKTEALLAFLAFYPHRSHPREELVDRLWPDAEIGPGRNRLSQALGWLRTHLEIPEAISGSAGSVILADRRAVGINPHLMVTDIGEFEKTLASAGKHSGASQAELLKQAVSLYQGELLPGHYEDWVLTERSRLVGLFLSALRMLVRHYEETQDWEPAETYARRALAADPLDEALHCDLMRLLAASGQVSAAQRQFRVMEKLLAEEMEGTPSPVAFALLEQIRLNHTQSAPSNRSFPPSLPTPLTRFFGRETEIAQTQTLLQTDGVRLVTLTGTGGAGKTRLALEVGACLQKAYIDATWFVPLADVRDTKLLPTALADSLRLPHRGATPAMELVVDALAHRPSLLILDNMEHLQDEAVSLLGELLAQVPMLKILVTSRHRLGLEGEQEVVVLPLPIPTEITVTEADPKAIERLMCVESIRLFTDRARAVRPDFMITHKTASTMTRLCRRLEGLPLALELCAAWAQTLTPAQMLSQLTRRFDLLVSRRTDIAPRHRSLRAAVEYSYLLLPTDLQEFFVSLSIFRGGWTLEAAETICWNTDHNPLSVLTALTELRERSLVTAESGEDQGSSAEEPEMRYRMLEALREFAAEQQTLAVKGPLQSAHAHYFLHLAETASLHMSGPNQREWLRRLEAEHDNLRAALDWALETHATETGLRIAGALALFWDVRGFLSEGEGWLSRLLALPKEAHQSREQQAVRAKALYAQGLLARGRTEFATAEATTRQALALWQELADDRGAAMTLQLLATLAYSREDYDEARNLLEESLPCVRRLGDPSLLARVLNSQGNIAMEQRDWAQAEAHFSESLNLHQVQGDRKQIAATLNNLGLVARYRGDYPTALRLLQEDLVICQELSDRTSIAISLLNLGTVHRLERRFAEAHLVLSEALTLVSEAESRRAFAWCVKEIGHLACAEAEFSVGVRLLAASEGLRHTLGMSFKPADPDELERDTAQAQAVLGKEHYTAAWDRGIALSFAEASAEASDFVDTPRKKITKNAKMA